MVRFAALAILFLTSCATLGEQSRAVLHLGPDALPRTAEIGNAPFVSQNRNYCGPATLAMAMLWAGQSISPDDLAPEVYIEKGKGTLQTDLISASRRHGLVAVPVDGMKALLTEVAAGHPVIVLENLGFTWFTRWHYSLVVGYDLDKQEVIMHSGEKANLRKDLFVFERGWKLGGYWGLLVLPPEKLSITGGSLDHLRAAIGIEQAGRLDEADQAFEKILERWPGNLAALIGIGNVAYRNKDYTRAVDYLKKAVNLHPQSHAAKHNLTVAQRAAFNEVFR